MKRFNLRTLVELITSNTAERVLVGDARGIDDLIARAFYALLEEQPHLLNLVWKNSEEELAPYWKDRNCRPGEFACGHKRIELEDMMRAGLMAAVYDRIDYLAIAGVGDLDGEVDFIFLVTPDTISLEEIHADANSRPLFDSQ